MTQVLADWIATERALWRQDHAGAGFPVVRCDLDGGVRRSPGDRPASADWGEWRSQLSWTAVYLYLGREGQPLYVGVTVDPDRRLIEHMGSPFWVEAAAVVVTWRSSRSSALARETTLIDTLAPPYNRARRVEPQTRSDHELVLWADGKPHRHPHEDALIGETEFVCFRSGQCWDCASPRTLAAALEGRAPLRFAPARPSGACPCRRRRKVAHV